MLLRQPRFTLTATLFPYTTPFRAHHVVRDLGNHGTGNPRRNRHADTDFEIGEERLHAVVAVDQVDRTDVGPQRGIERSRAGTGSIDKIDRAQIVERRQRLRTVHPDLREEEHTAALQSLMRISYAVSCLHKNKLEVIYVQARDWSLVLVCM